MSSLRLDDGKTDATDISATFYTHFQAKRKDISSRLEALDVADSRSNTDKSVTSSISSDIVTLRKELIDATPYLPSYDQGKCEQQLKVLEESLSHHRAPKSKFAFKRKPVTPSILSEISGPLPSREHTSSIRQAGPSNTPTTTHFTLSSQSTTQLTLSSLARPAEASVPWTAGLPRSSDITLTDLRECIVNLFPSAIYKDMPDETKPTLTITALHARDLRRVLLVIPSIDGSVLLHDIHDSVIVVGCHQFRIHNSKNTTILLHVLSKPVIERSQGIRVGRYPVALQEASRRGFFERPSNHAMMQDFDWIKLSPSPNWSLLELSVPLEEQVVEAVNRRVIEGNDVKKTLGDVLPPE